MSLFQQSQFTDGFDAKYKTINGGKNPKATAIEDTVYAANNSVSLNESSMDVVNAPVVSALSSMSHRLAPRHALQGKLPRSALEGAFRERMQNDARLYGGHMAFRNAIEWELLNEREGNMTVTGKKSSSVSLESLYGLFDEDLHVSDVTGC